MKTKTSLVWALSILMGFAMTACVIVDNDDDPIDRDGDGYDSTVDCNDRSAAINPAADEICDDGLDNDCDGEFDEFDDECDPGTGGTGGTAGSGGGTAGSGGATGGAGGATGGAGGAVGGADSAGGAGGA